MNISVPLGLRYMLLSALGFSLMAAGVKQASNYSIPVMEIVAVRAIVSLLLSYLDIKRKKIPVWGTNKRLLLARGTVGSIALMCVYFAVSTLPLAEATLLQYTYPACTVLLALVFLKEKVQFATIICIGLSLLGLVVMMTPNLMSSNGQLPTISVVAALFGAFSSAIAYILVRKLSRVENTSVIIFYFPLIALPSSLILLGDDFIMPDGQSIILLIAIGVFTQIGQVGLTKAMAVETAGKAAAYSYVQVIFAIALGIVLFDNIPNIWTWLGGSLIMVGALFNALYKR